MLRRIHDGEQPSNALDRSRLSVLVLVDERLHLQRRTLDRSPLALLDARTHEQEGGMDQPVVALLADTLQHG